MNLYEGIKNNLGGEKITIKLYGDTKTFNSRQEAINYIQEAISYCDPNSSECQRYYNIYQQLKSGKSSCSDELNESEHFTPEEMKEYEVDEEGIDENGEQWIHCNWCEEVYPVSECKKELNLGWLCSRCQDALWSRGERPVYDEYAVYGEDELNESESEEDFWKYNLTLSKYRVEVSKDEDNNKPVVSFYTYDENAYTPEDIINSSYFIARYYLDTLLEDAGTGLNLGSGYTISGYDWQEVLSFISNYKSSINEAEESLPDNWKRRHEFWKDEESFKKLDDLLHKKVNSLPGGMPGSPEHKARNEVWEDIIYARRRWDRAKKNLSESASIPTIVSVDPNYTGGGIYTYSGKLSDGNYFMAEDSDFDREDKSFMILFVNEDPNTAIDPETGEELAWFWDEWQKPHLVKALDFGSNEARAFTKQLLKWIIKNKPDGNYAVEDMEKMLDVINSK